MLRTAPVDPNRIGITGWSYGGFMTMWTITQTSLFRAAVVGAGLANWQSYYGENEIDKWMLPYFGASVYDDPAAGHSPSRSPTRPVCCLSHRIAEPEHRRDIVRRTNE